MHGFHNNFLSKHLNLNLSLTLRNRCPYMELFWSAFFPHFPAFPYLSVFSPNAGKCGENVNQNNSEYGHFLRSATQLILITLVQCSISYTP